MKHQTVQPKDGRTKRDMSITPKTHAKVPTDCPSQFAANEDCSLKPYVIPGTLWAEIDTLPPLFAGCGSQILAGRRGKPDHNAGLRAANLPQ